MEKLPRHVRMHWASDEELPHIFEIRKTVFIEGQQVSKELEQDSLDDQAKHVILYEHDTPVGCARIRWMSLEMEGTRTETSLYWKVERLAVLEEARNKGYGKLIMEWIIRQAEEHQIAGLTLHAQTQLEQFYQQVGFITEGKPFMEAGIKHITMNKTIHQPKRQQKRKP